MSSKKQDPRRRTMLKITCFALAFAFGLLATWLLHLLRDWFERIALGV